MRQAVQQRCDVRKDQVTSCEDSGVIEAIERDERGVRQQVRR